LVTFPGLRREALIARLNALGFVNQPIQVENRGLLLFVRDSIRSSARS
jgi:hypothetical protein